MGERVPFAWIVPFSSFGRWQTKLEWRFWGFGIRVMRPVRRNEGDMVQRRPQGRSAGILVETLDAGLVLYDREVDEAHSLDAKAARVWSAADGKRTVVDIAEVCQLDEATAVAALDQLEASGLLMRQPGVSRRALVKRAAVAGAVAVAAAPLIETVLIPTAAAHASTMPTGGGNPLPPPVITPILDFSVTADSRYVINVESGPSAGATFVLGPSDSFTLTTDSGGRIKVTNNVTVATIANQGSLLYQVIDSDAGSTPASLSPGQSASFPTSPGAAVQVNSEG